MFRHQRRLERHGALPWVHGVDVLGLAVALQFHVPRYLNVVEVPGAAVLPEKVRLPLGRTGCPREFPRAVEQLHQRGTVGVCLGKGGVALVVGVRGNAVYGENFGVGEPVQCVLHENSSISLGVSDSVPVILIIPQNRQKKMDKVTAFMHKTLDSLWKK